MYLFCVELDLELEQTAGLIGRETKGLYLSTAKWLSQPWCLWSLLCHPNSATEPYRGNEETQPTLCLQTWLYCIVTLCPWVMGFYLALQLRNNRSNYLLTIYPLPTYLI